MRYSCLKLPVQQQAEVRTRWGVEKRMHSAAGRLFKFSLFATYMKIAHARQVDIIELSQLREDTSK